MAKKGTFRVLHFLVVLDLYGTVRWQGAQVVELMQLPGAGTTVTASNAKRPWSAEEFRLAMSRHVEKAGYSSVEFIERLDPQRDLNQDDYVVAYEAIFQPADLEHAYLEVWITDDGLVSIMFERRSRVAKRLGTRLWTAKRACAAGCEIASITPDELIAFVHLVGQGRVIIQVGSGVFGLGPTTAGVSPEDFKSLESTNPFNWDWLTVISPREIASSRPGIIHFEPW